MLKTSSKSSGHTPFLYCLSKLGHNCQIFKICFSFLQLECRVKHRWHMKSQKSEINISHLQPTFSFSADRRSACTHAGGGGGGGGGGRGQFCGSRLHVNDLMCDWLVLGFPCFYQWWVIKHCSPPLSFQLIQKIYLQQTVSFGWKVEELNCDKMNFINAGLLLQFLYKLVKDKNNLFI